jgi:RNA polymerase sigma-70 factor (ECF subfamily)
MEPPEDDDRRLIDSFLETRREDVFRKLHRRHAARLYSLVRRLAPPSRADDVYQECWTRIVEKLSTFAWRSSFATWSSGIALNCVREAQRGREPRGEVPAETAAPGPASTHRSELRLDVEEALRRLADGYRAVLVLHDIHGHTHEEIADLLGIAAGTSKSQLSRARASIRSLLDGESSHV